MRLKRYQRDGHGPSIVVDPLEVVRAIESRRRKSPVAVLDLADGTRIVALDRARTVVGEVLAFQSAATAGRAN